MNERIKELAKQAGIEFTYDPTETPMRAFAECWADELTKFAESIVRECAQLAEDIDGHPRARKIVLEHFGVDV
jgi:hypothetical protein